MPRFLVVLALWCVIASVASGCDGPVRAAATVGLTPGPSAALATIDVAARMCRHRVGRTRGRAVAPGAPGFDAQRPYILGRALAEPVVFVREPPPPAVAPATPSSPRSFGGVVRLVRRYRHDRAGLRDRVLRGGYLYSESPAEAYALVRELRLDGLFDADEIFLLRGATVHRLSRAKMRGGGHHYRHADGPRRGREAKILLFDRVATTRAAVMTDVVHRDVRGLRDRVGFDRIRMTHLTETTAVAEFRFEDRWVPAHLESDGPRLHLDCLDADARGRAEARAAASRSAGFRRATHQLRRVVDAMAAERLPFDRPRGAEDHLSDGRLRPAWEGAFRRGHHGFVHDEKPYAVFDSEGRPHPPQMCVSFILDSFERAAGTWYAARGEVRERRLGRLDFNAFGIQNRAGVLAFERFALATPALFRASRFDERIEFRHRSAFFDHLVANADRFRPGDVVAIQGPKRDGYIHQHAILIEDVDPVTGMPHALADQMKAPRHRTWEMVMAEAPRRALIYHVAPTSRVWAALDPGAEEDDDDDAGRGREVAGDDASSPVASRRGPP
ncbi:MAG: hypothetical protein AAF715_05130 [Myxococcota bacterium]